MQGLCLSPLQTSSDCEVIMLYRRRRSYTGLSLCNASLSNASFPACTRFRGIDCCNIADCSCRDCYFASIIRNSACGSDGCQCRCSVLRPPCCKSGSFCLTSAGQSCYARTTLLHQKHVVLSAAASARTVCPGHIFIVCTLPDTHTTRRFASQTMSGTGAALKRKYEHLQVRKEVLLS